MLPPLSRLPSRERFPHPQPQSSDILVRCHLAGADLKHVYQDLPDETGQGLNLGVNVSLLHVAARNNHSETVSRLVELGLDVDVRNAHGMTPLMTASFMGAAKVRNHHPKVPAHRPLSCHSTRAVEPLARVTYHAVPEGSLHSVRCWGINGPYCHGPGGHSPFGMVL